MSAIEPLRVANRLAGHKIYEWMIIAKDLSPIIGSNGLSIVPEKVLSQAPAADLIVVCASFDVPDFSDPKIFNFLRRRAQLGAAIAAVGSGTLILARAGLLDGHKCTIHWEMKPAFAEEFPGLSISSNIFEIDRNRMTCGGGVAALDMMLHIIAKKHGADLALAISSTLLQARLRTPHDHQRTAVTLRLEQISPRLSEAVRLMEKHIHTPLTIPKLSKRIGLAQRQLERIFRRHFGATPHQYYMDMRLDFARQLLLDTAMSVLNVAVASGFASSAHFGQRYCNRFGLTPSEHRRVSVDADYLQTINTRKAVVKKKPTASNRAV